MATAESDPRAQAALLQEDGEVCPRLHAAIELIGKRWNGAVICALAGGPMRFGEISRSVPGISDRLLSQRLRELEREELVARTVEAGSPVRVRYELTAKGDELRPVIRQLKGWADRWA